MDKLTHIDLFSGIGGFALGLESTNLFKTVAFCEIEDFPRRVLRKHWPTIPIHDDIKTFPTHLYENQNIDIITGGFPCQPVSLAGARKGKEDKRWLWPELARVIDAIRPRWCLIENVIGLRTKHGDEVLADLERQGYAARPLVVGAVHAGAPHRRQRVWIVAHAQSKRWQTERQRWQPQNPGTGADDEAGNAADFDGSGLAQRQSQPGDSRQKRTTLERGDEQGNAAHTTEPRLQRCTRERLSGARRASVELTSDRKQWDWRRAPEPVLRGVDDGIPCRMDRRKRIAALGNAVVPQVVAAIGRTIIWQHILS